MRSVLRCLPLVLLSILITPSAGQDTAIFKVTGRGVEGRDPYRGGGAVAFLGVTVDAQVIHLSPEGKIALPLEVEYRVIEPAPILLTSRLGTEHWQLYQFATEGMAAMYTDQKIDLSRQGKGVARSTRAWFGKNYGPTPEAGLVGVRGHYYLLVDRPDGKWLDVTDPPAFFNRADVLRDVTFTLADLSEYELAIPEIQSTWQPGGPFRIRLVIRDAQGKTLSVVGAPIVARAGDWQVNLTTEWTPLDEPTGWMRSTLPNAIPEKLAVSGKVVLQTPGGLKTEAITASFVRGTGRVDADQFKIAEQGYELAKAADGTIRETRAVWVSPSDIMMPDDIDQVIDRCREGPAERDHSRYLRP